MRDPEKKRAYVERERLRRAAWVKANPEKEKARQARWRKANPEKIQARGLRRREANPEKERARSAGWREANPEKNRVIKMTWRKNNPGKDQGYGSARRARKLEAFVEAVDHEAVFVRDGGVCQICDRFIGAAKWHIDHRVPLSKGGEHSYRNCQLAHATCNISKHNKYEGATNA